MTGQSVLTLLLFITLLMSCGGESKKEAKKRERVFDVVTVGVRKSFHQLRHRTSGYVEAVHSVRLKPEVSGKVVKIIAREGDRLRVGDPLLKIEDLLYRKSYEETLWRLRQAQEELKNQESIYKRRKALYEKELISREEFDEAYSRFSATKAQVESLKAQLEKKKLELEKTILRAPIEGIVQKRLVEVGDYVSPQKAVYEIVKLSPQRVVFKVPQELIKHISIGSEVRFSAEDKKYTAKVSYISPSTDDSRMFTVKATHEGAELRPGSYLELSFPVGKIEAVAVPEQALQLTERESFLWVVRNSRAIKLPVRVLSHREGMVLVDGDFKDRDRVVVEGFMFLYEGAQVRER